MKRYIIRFALCAGVLFTVFSCGADYLDINDNPNVATRPPLDGLLADASYNTALNQQRVSGGHAAFFVQYLASPNEASTTDIYLEVSGGGAWSNLYNTMTNIFDLIRFGEEDGALAHVGIGKVLMAINLGLVADNWGNAPYTDAFSGTNLRPTYDTAEDLYQTIFTLLDEAENALDAFDGTPNIKPGSDFLFEVTGNDDLDPWRKTISALRARYLNHLSETGQYDANAVLSAVDGGFASSDEDADLRTFQVRNPWAQVAVNNDALLLGGWLSEQFIDALNGTTYGVFDPRLPLLTDTTIFGDYRGTPNGVGRTGDGTQPDETYLQSDKGPAATDASLDIITFTELKFIEAEAALAAGNQDRADVAFRAGIRANMNEVGVAADAIESYLTDSYGGEDDDIDRDDIFREKYVALFLHPETWVDARRYDYAYDDFTLAANAAITTFPVRLQYPNTELDRNRANTPTVTLTDALFWDQ